MPKMLPLWCCECCNTTPFSSYQECQEHEASIHFGLTVNEYVEWRKLHRQARHAGYSVSVTRNEITEQAYTDACKRLADFETLHNLTDKQKPTSFFTQQ